jgi:hypothetical protein
LEVSALITIKYSNKQDLEIMVATMSETVRHPKADDDVVAIEEHDSITGEWMGGIRKTDEGMWAAEIMAPE